MRQAQGTKWLTAQGSDTQLGFWVCSNIGENVHPLNESFERPRNFERVWHLHGKRSIEIGSSPQKQLNRSEQDAILPCGCLERPCKIASCCESHLSSKLWIVLHNSVESKVIYLHNHIQFSFLEVTGVNASETLLWSSWQELRGLS